MYTKLLCIINVGFHLLEQLLIRYSAFFRYWKDKWQCNGTLYQLFVDFEEACDRITQWGEEYEGVSKSFRTGLLEQEMQMVQLSATRCSYIAIFWVSIVSFAAITLCVASQRVFIVVSIYFIIDSVRKLLVTPSYCTIFSLNLVYLWIN